MTDKAVEGLAEHFLCPVKVNGGRREERWEKEMLEGNRLMQFRLFRGGNLRATANGANKLSEKTGYIEHGQPPRLSPTLKHHTFFYVC